MSEATIGESPDVRYNVCLMPTDLWDRSPPGDEDLHGVGERLVGVVQEDVPPRGSPAKMSPT